MVILDLKSNIPSFFFFISKFFSFNKVVFFHIDLGLILFFLCFFVLFVVNSLQHVLSLTCCGKQLCCRRLALVSFFMVFVLAV